MCVRVKLLQCLHQNKVSVKHNWLFVSGFDLLLLMYATVGGKWLCNDLHSDACLEVSVMVDLQSAHGVWGYKLVTVESYKGRITSTLWLQMHRSLLMGSLCCPSCAVQDCLVCACVDISIWYPYAQT